ncbi:MAG: iron-containing alcohol dehydrogenase, partial [Lachnospiraceae bacterium]|nr:iron-containing alcohol dehydrogenase [Lachnospiraceae bacterium]
DGTNVVAREKMANAATLAGMAFANAFLGVCHSMAHKLGAYHHIAHGVANALMLEEVIRFNSKEAPHKMGTFPQYDHPKTLRRYAEIAEYLGLEVKESAAGKGGKKSTGKAAAGKKVDEATNADYAKVEALIAAVNDLKEKIGIKKTIKDYVPDEAEFLRTLDEMSENAFDDQCTGANPRYPLISEIKQMFLNAYYGKHEEV